LKNEISQQEMVEEINVRTRQYAKKQFTWFNNEPIDLKIEIDSHLIISEIVQKIISSYNSNT